MAALTESFWQGRPVFVTGHTGFKGGWLVTWLLEMGARVTGYALAPDTSPSYFELCGLDRKMASIFGDILDQAALERALRAAAPEVIFHLAAQSLVRRSYREPIATFATNVMGTANVLETTRNVDTVRAIIVVTSDKCYENREWLRGYREGDLLGGHDPYSASKACAELVAAAYGHSFFAAPGCSIVSATVRAGNVIGGGDWAEDRLVPDAIRALSRGEPLALRNAHSIRPWQHILEPVGGYLLLAERLCREGRQWSGAWNFGPTYTNAMTTAALIERIFAEWGGGSWQTLDNSTAPREAQILNLDCSKARHLLGWRPRFTMEETIALTIAWYRSGLRHGQDDMYACSAGQIRHYCQAEARLPTSVALGN
jgi:CDP-glucose 4,6-dehydratase